MRLNADRASPWGVVTKRALTRLNPATRMLGLMVHGQPGDEIHESQGSIRIQDLLQYCSTKPTEPEQSKKKASVEAWTSSVAAWAAFHVL